MMLEKKYNYNQKKTLEEKVKEIGDLENLDYVHPENATKKQLKKLEDLKNK